MLIPQSSLLLDLVLGRAVGICCLDPPIRVLPHPGAIWIQYVLLSAGVFDGLDAILLYPLDGSIRKDRLFFTISKNALDGSIRESTIDKNK